MFHLALARLQELNWTGPVAYHYENEPLLNPNLLSQIAQTCRALPRCIPTLVTNGDLLTHEQMDALVEAGVGRVIVSRHPPFRDAWDARIEAVRHAWPDRVSMMQVGVTLPVHKNGQFDHDGIAWQGHCIAPSLCLGIRMNGDVPLCGCDAKHLAVMGNIQTQSLNEIWRGREFCALRRTLRNGNLGHKICMGCSGMI